MSKSNLSRRSFLKGAAALGVAATGTLMGMDAKAEAAVFTPGT